MHGNRQAGSTQRSGVAILAAGGARVWSAVADTGAFADHWGFQRRPLEVWGRLTVGSEDFRPDLSRVALDGDQIAAYVLADVLAQARRDGLEKAWLGVDTESPTGAVGVYERIGFVHGVRYAGYRRDM